MKRDDILKLAELLTDEAYTDQGVCKYAERQELTVKFNEILVKNLMLHGVVVPTYTEVTACLWCDKKPIYKETGLCKKCFDSAKM